MDSVVQLVNRLQSAATLLGDNAASDKTLPSLWELLPSIVVIGGQARCGRILGILPSCSACALFECKLIWPAPGVALGMLPFLTSGLCKECVAVMGWCPSATGHIKK